METRENSNQKKSLIPVMERKWVILAIGIAIALVIWQYLGLLHTPLSTLHSKRFEHTFKNFGSNARIAIFFALAYYVLLRIIRLHVLKDLVNIKKWLSTLLRFARKWHTPIAIIAIAFIILHTIAVFMYGFEFDFNNISGLLALLVLLPVPISGLFRYQRLDRKWHLRSGIVFAILFLIHSFL
ncbi:hypothetical protein [Ammoniphilus resinae]|uniref:NADH:ubiquinone oxidoreductase subunit 3 (Subunit A) n=1 Tax=Ammoniphilus resinae TaxID=861532 RepID=A0ABS4GXE3_9BACL|nr:hypothetical protein [Ammoniphilus resinae]MBP1934916.1 NADH:ubiquinone oxidoreductase subunit 3 (subunit A) [Ammoniphilus resinae]